MIGRLKRSLRRSTNPDNIMMASQQARLTGRNQAYRENLPAPVQAPIKGLQRDDPLAGYDRAVAMAGMRHGVHDDTISKRALKRALR